MQRPCILVCSIISREASVDGVEWRKEGSEIKQRLDSSDVLVSQCNECLLLEVIWEAFGAFPSQLFITELFTASLWLLC